MVTAKQFIAAFKRYHVDTGIAWDVFWDYSEASPRMNSERKGLLLHMYLDSFGMNRAGLMANVSQEQWREFFQQTNHAVKELKSFEFGQLRDSSVVARRFDECIDFITRCLPEHSSGSPLLISKVLLALTGHIPAYDCYFKAWLGRQGWGPQRPCYQSLLQIQEGLSRQGISHKTLGGQFTRLGCASRIPFGRIVDCVGWQMGWDLKSAS